MKSQHREGRPTATWLLVADSGRARIFSRSDEAPADLTLVLSLECPDSKLPPHEQVSDRQGYFRGRAGSLDAGDPQTDFKHRQAQRFAREIVSELESGRQRGAFCHLILVAAPMFLGEIRSQLTDSLMGIVEQSVDKDYTALSCEEIAARLSLTC